MENEILYELRDYVIRNHPDLVLSLPPAVSVTQFLKDKIASARPTIEKMKTAQLADAYIIQAVVRSITSEFKPSKFKYIKTVLMEEFPREHNDFFVKGVITFEVIKVMELCKDLFETFDFSEGGVHSNFLRHAVIARIHGYLN